LSEAGVHAHIETDHYHYFQGGGEFYATLFSTWRSHRGQEFDPCATPLARPPEPDHLGRWDAQYDRNRGTFRREEDYPTPATFRGAIDWLEMNREADNWLLWVEAFDPHEPFDCPPRYLEPYGDSWSGPRYDWSGYERVEEQDPATVHLRVQYAATLSMADAWFGRLMETVEALPRAEDVLLVLTTDHGHLLGEHGATGKNRWHCWNELARLPLMIRFPGRVGAGTRRSMVTQNIDLLPTLMEAFGVSLPHPIHGRSFLAGAEPGGGREAALFGWFGRTVNLFDGRHTYFRAPSSLENRPLNQYVLMPTTYHRRIPEAAFADAQLGRFLPWTACPVLRLPAEAPLQRGSELARTMLFDIEEDPGQQRDLTGGRLEESLASRLAEAMRGAEAPAEQFERLGLA
jgi:arylsulfatase A-like enzyme